MNFSSSSRRLWPDFSLAALLGALFLSACGGGGSTSPQATPTPASTPGATPTLPPGSNAALIAFAMAPEGGDSAQTDIYLSAPDGSNLRRLTQSAPDAEGNVQPQGAPALSPDRRRVVYVSVASENGESVPVLKLINADGSGARVLSADASTRGASSPAWSPDGTRIAFSRGNDGIFTINADGSGARRLTDKGANPSWSVSNRIAFNAAPDVRTTTQATQKPLLPQTQGVLPATTDSPSEIFTIGAEGGALRGLTQRSQTPGGLAVINPAWSPDGRSLVFNSIPGSGLPAQLFLVQGDGSNRRALTGVNGTDAVWSPDGRRLAYSDEAGLAIVNSDGTNRVLVGTPDGFFVEDTDWR